MPEEINPEPTPKPRVGEWSGLQPRRQWVARFNPERATAASRDDWATPEWVIRFLEDLYGIEFNMDVAANMHNRKTQHYFSIETEADWIGHTLTGGPPFGYLGKNGLLQDWSKAKLFIRNLHDWGMSDRFLNPTELKPFNNPPYQAEWMVDWIWKHQLHWERDGIRSVALLPAHTDRNWFDVLTKIATSVTATGRIAFEGTTSQNPTGSVVAGFGLEPVTIQPWLAGAYYVRLPDVVGQRKLIAAS